MEQQVGKVGVGWKGFETRRDVVVDAGGELQLVGPLLVATAVGEEDDLPTWSAT